MAKVRPHGAPARQRAQQVPAPRSEPASPQDQERLARISSFAETLLKAAHRGGHPGSGPLRIVANPVGMSPFWSFTQIQEMRKRAKRGGPVSWEIDISSPTSRTVEIVDLPMLDCPARSTAAKPPGRPQVLSDLEWGVHLERFKLSLGLSPKRRAELLSKALDRKISRSTVRRRLQNSQ